MNARPHPAPLRSLMAAGWLAASAATAAVDPFAEGVRPTEPLPPDRQAATFRLPPGFSMQLVAAEPDINKPMNMAFDARGRLWVTTSREYPFPAPTNQPGRDRIMIFEDFGPDGRARKVTTFADGLNIPIGIHPLEGPKNACLAWSIPYIWKLEDTDGDGRVDRRTPWLGPFDHTRDTHGNQASFRRNFDGWLYATHGFNNDSKVQGRDGNIVRMNSGNTYRFQLDGSRVEHHTWGQVNPFGLAWDPRGNLYSSDCHSAPVYQLLAGGYYPSFGKPHDGLGFAPTLMEHSHGSTAIDGMVYYADDLWPDEFHGNTFIGNVMTSRLNRDRYEQIGSTPKAIELPDLVRTDDPWFRPVDNLLGPDGALYIADFYNRIIGHYEVPLTHPGRDRERGRIWRLVYTGKPLRSVALPDTLDGLVSELGSPNLNRRLLALNTIADRHGLNAVPAIRPVFDADNTSAAARVSALWLLERLGGVDAQRLTRAARHADPLVRTHAMRVLTERGQLVKAGRLEKNAVAEVGRLARPALQDNDALVRRCAAEALGAVPDYENVGPLLDLRRQTPPADTHLVYVVRKALRDQLLNEAILNRVMGEGWTAEESRALADVAIAVQTPSAAAFLLRRLPTLARDPNPSPSVADILKHAARNAPENELGNLVALARSRLPDTNSAELYPELTRQFALFQSLGEGLQQRGVKLPEPVRDWGTQLVGRYFGSLDTQPAWQLLLDPAHPTAVPWDFETRRDINGKSRRLMSSLPHGEALTGRFRSPAFAAPESLRFWIAGHDGFPDRPAGRANRVRLLDASTGEVLTETLAPRNDAPRPVTWDLKAITGRKVVVEGVDGDTGAAYAWIAFGDFETALSQPRVPDISPRGEVDRFVTASGLAAQLDQRDLAPTFRRLTSTNNPMLQATVPDVTLAAVRALAALAPSNAPAELAPLLTRAGTPDSIREQVGITLAGLNPAGRVAVTAALKTAPHRLALPWALALATTRDGAGDLLTAMEKGAASPRLLQTLAVKNRLAAAKPDRVDARLANLFKDLPPATDALDKLIARRRDGFRPDRARVADGERVFQQSCAACHAIGGRGGNVGPNLDGLGNRGLERICEDILDPNRNVDEAFRTTLLILKNDDVTSGLFRREEGAMIVLAESTGRETSVPRADVKERRESKISLMPDNFGETIPPDDFNNLLAYLLAQRPANGK